MFLLAWTCLAAPPQHLDAPAAQPALDPRVEDVALMLDARAAGHRSAASPVVVAAGEELTLEIALRRTETHEVLGPVRIAPYYSRPGGSQLLVGAACASSPFSYKVNPSEKEVVVGLRSTVDELRVLDFSNGQFVELYRADLPEWIEALDTGDADNDGREDIVVGLRGSSTPNHVRIFRYDPIWDSLVQQSVSGSLGMHVEAVAIGDADNDGLNEIVVGLERVTAAEPLVIPRLLLFEYHGGTWIGPEVVAPAEALSVQDLAIGDTDGDGRNEIAVVFSNVTSDPPARQVRTYEYAAGQWVREDVTAMVTTGATGADRLIIADVDPDPGNEILATFWSGAFSGVLREYEFQGGTWVETTIDSSVGYIEALDAGDFDGDGRADLVGGVYTHTNVPRAEYWTNLSGSWSLPAAVSEIFPFTDIFALAVGDADNDLCDEAIVVVDETLYAYEPGSTQPVASMDFPADIDSVELCDIDDDEPIGFLACDLRTSSSCALPYSLRASASAGSSWELSFRATALVRPSSGGPARYASVSSAPLHVLIR